MQLYSYKNFVPQLFHLTNIPYQQDAFTSACQSFGWEVTSDEYAFPNHETVLNVQNQAWPLPLTALFGNDQMTGLFLFALVSQGEDTDSYHNDDRVWFDNMFIHAKQAVTDIVGEPSNVGTYAATFSQDVFNYAVWGGTYAYLVLLQHEEGDANFGHNATLDVRIIPRGNTTLDFPLRTDLIF